LAYCSIPSITEFSKLFSPKLTVLDISGFTMDMNTISLLSSLPHLIKLRCHNSQLPKIQIRIPKFWQFKQDCIFPELQYLDLKSSTKLEVVVLQLPELTSLNLEECTQIKILELKTPKLSYIKLDISVPQSSDVETKNIIMKIQGTK